MEVVHYFRNNMFGMERCSDALSCNFQPNMDTSVDVRLSPATAVVKNVLEFLAGTGVETSQLCPANMFPVSAWNKCLKLFCLET